MEWISVKDRLPEEMCFVIGFGGEEVAPVVFCEGEFGMWTPDGLACFNNITHWMPLPTPPELK